VYIGEWSRDSKLWGKGAMFRLEGDLYNGPWLNDLPYGEGILIFANQDDRGNFSEGKHSGFGTYVNREGQMMYPRMDKDVSSALTKEFY
jgi:hypothetical protein